jgi:hypothetical protein
MTRQIKSPPRPDKVAAFRVGISPASRAAVYLVAKDYRILAQRNRSPTGNTGALPPAPKPGSPPIHSRTCSTCASMQRWWRRVNSRVTFKRHLGLDRHSRALRSSEPGIQNWSPALAVIRLDRNDRVI